MGLRPGLAIAAALAAATAFAPAAQATDWSTFGFDAARTNENPRERTLGVANAPTLRETWSTPLGGVINTQPVVAASVRVSRTRRADLVLAGTAAGDLWALDAATGRPVWRRRLGARRVRCGDLPQGRYGVTATPTLDRARNRVYSADGQGRLHALSLATGAEARGWPVTVTPAPDREHVWGGIARRGNRLYAGTSSHCDTAFYRGRLVAIDARRARVVARWFPLAPRYRGGGMWGWGGASIDSGGDVYVATSTTQAGNEIRPYAQRVVRLSGGLRLKASHRPDVPVNSDSDFGATPLLYRAPGCPPQLAVLHKSGALLVYDRDRIAAGPRQTVHVGRRDLLAAYGTYAYSRAVRTLYVANNSTGDFTHGLVALRVNAACALELAWQQAAGPDPAVLTPPTVANGVVYMGTGFGREVQAFDATTGARLWTSPAFEKPVYAAPTVVNGHLYAGAWDERLHAFAPATP
jgi:outer membrane protein assembly factor BamB